MSYNSGSNRARNFESASRDFEITRPITPWIVLHSVQLLLLITLEDIEAINTEKMTTKQSEEYFFTSAARKRQQTLKWLTIIWFSLFIGLFQRAKMHFTPPNSPFWLVKCATMPYKVFLLRWPLLVYKGDNIRLPLPLSSLEFPRLIQTPNNDYRWR